MKHLLLGVILASLTADRLALAANGLLPVYKTTLPGPAPPSWSGWYVGGNIGAAFNMSTHELDPSGCFLPNTGANCGAGGAAANPFRTFANHSTNAALTGGGQIGYNWQFAPRLVAGIETDFNSNGVNQTDAGATVLSGPLAGITAKHSLTQQLDWFGTFRGRVGLTPAPEWLAYVTGGLAYGNESSSNKLGPVQCCGGEIYGGSISATRLFGWTAGAGIERILAPGWSIKAEYLYVDLGSLSYLDPCITARSLGTTVCGGFGSPPTYRASLATREQVVRLGVNYHFDMAGFDRSEPWHPTERQDPTSRIYGGAEYLFWSAKGAPLGVPLVSTGPIGTTHHGFLINSDTTILYGAPFAPAVGGNDTQNFPDFSGSRLTLGYWLDGAQRLALETSAFGLQSRSVGFAVHADANGQPVVNIPVYNTISYTPGGRPGGGPPNEDGLPAALPLEPGRADGGAGVFTGGVSITNSLQLWGADATGVVNLYRDNAVELSGLGGFRYINLSERFNLVYDSEGVSGFYVGLRGAAHDQFQTRNQFYGALLGLRGSYSWERFFVETTARAAVGLSHEVLEISGGYYSTNYLGSFRSGPEGVFAQPANEGSYSAERLALVPEIEIALGYHVTSSIRLTVSYDFLYESSVVRPGDNINRDLPKGQTFQQAGTSVSATSPASLFKTTDFYVQGLSVGLAASF